MHSLSWSNQENKGPGVTTEGGANSVLQYVKEMMYFRILSMAPDEVSWNP